MNKINVYIDDLQKYFIYYSENQEIELNYLTGNIENIYLKSEDTTIYYVFEFYNIVKCEIYLLHLDVKSELSFIFINYILHLIYTKLTIADLYIVLLKSNFIFKISTDSSLNVRPYFDNRDKLYTTFLGHGEEFYRTVFNILKLKIFTLSYLFNFNKIFIMQRTSIITTKQLFNSPIPTVNLLIYNFKDISCKIDISLNKYRLFLQENEQYQVGKNNINRAGYNMLLNTYPKLPIWQ